MVWQFGAWLPTKSNLKSDHSGDNGAEHPTSDQYHAVMWLGFNQILLALKNGQSQLLQARLLALKNYLLHTLNRDLFMSGLKIISLAAFSEKTCLIPAKLAGRVVTSA